jgi:hypothetical protein
LNEKNGLVQDSTITFTQSQGGKPPHRIRNRYNFIRPLVDAKVSSSTQRIPSYDVSATTSDPNDIDAAAIAKSVAVYGYDKWRVKDAAKRVIKNAVVSGDGFAWPYFDPNVAPYTQVGSKWVGQGEVKLMILSGNQVYWEPGVIFENSRWFAVEMAMPMDAVKEWPGFDSRIVLQADGNSSDYPADRTESDNLVVVTCYFERPCPKYPTGRYFWIANKRVIIPETDYPLIDAKGTVLDEPCIHRLRYTTDPESDHDLGLVFQLIDYQRTIQDCYNKLLEWKNRVLNPQMLSPEGSMGERRNDIPGYNYTYKPVGNLKPEWEPPVTSFVQPLQAILEQAKQDMQYVAADLDLSQVLAPNVASSSIQASVDQSSSRWAAFLSDLAEWHSRVMRHCLLLTSRYYTEPRLVQIRGERGVTNIQAFQGANILDQVNVTVAPGSLESKSHAAILQEVFGYFDRQMISANDALMAIQTRNTDGLTYSMEADRSRINTIIQRIVDGTIMQSPPIQTVDPMTGAIITVPSWMPTAQDDAEVWDKILSDWMKTDQYMQLQPMMQEPANLVAQAILRQKIAKANLAAQMQMASAQNLGMTNAAKPQGPGGTPSTQGSAGTPPPQQ